MRLPVALLLMLAAACVGRLAAQEPSNQQRGDKSSTEGSESAAAEKEAVAEDQKVIRSEQEWRKRLTREQFRVLRRKGTERPFRNKYDDHFEPGTYACAACGQELFASHTKFNSGCGWPAFYAAMAGDRVKLTPDFSLNMVRTEVTCARCDSHLGHIFNDAPQTPTGKRFCINSVSLKFLPAKSNGKGEEEEPTRKRRKTTREAASKTPGAAAR